MNYVEAIEEGKIVKVTEDYAKKENLFILKKIESSVQEPAQNVPAWKKRERDEKRALFDDYRKPLRHKDALLSELVDNFHWILQQKRKVRNITRKQLAQSINANELDIKMIENGVLPSRDLVLINKLEKFYGINLRKGSMNYQDSFRSKTLESNNKRRTFAPQSNQKQAAEQLVDSIKNDKETSISNENIELDL